MIWEKGLIKPELLKKDINIMNQVILKHLKKTFKKKLVGVYFKGSASRKWQSPIDYVPDLSDIDIHVLVKDQKDYLKAFLTIDKANKFSLAIEKDYLKLNKKASHEPLIQILSLNEMYAESDFIPAIKNQVITLFGKDYHYYSEKEHKKDLIERAKKQILDNENMIKKMNKRFLYKYSHNLSKYLYDLSWRISSGGPSILCLNGYKYENAWFLTRTQLVKELKKLGKKELTKHYVKYYMSAWKYFMTKDVKYLRESVIEGYKTISLMINEAKKTP